MSNKALIAYLNEFKAELQEMFEEFDHELGSHEDDALYQDAYNNIGGLLEDAINNTDNIISDVDDGKYDGYTDLDDDYEEYGGSE